MPISVKQLSLCDISSEFDSFMNSNEDSFLSIFNNSLNIIDFIPFLSIKLIILLLVERELIPLNLILAFIIKNILIIPTIDFYSSYFKRT